jgi:hypothetical protein
LLVDSINNTTKKFVRKVHTYNEAYIFVLEAEQLALNKIKFKKPVDESSGIQKSYVRFVEYLGVGDICPSKYYRALLFTDLISGMEIFFAELLRAILIKYPHKVGSSKIELKDLIDGMSLNAIIERKADEEIYQLMYEKPEDYLKKICKMLSLDEGKLLPFWPHYIEAKARRDLGVHNEWICNDTYLRKTAKHLFPFEANINDNLMPLDVNYCTSVGHNLLYIAEHIAVMMLEKHSNGKELTRHP